MDNNYTIQEYVIKNINGKNFLIFYDPFYNTADLKMAIDRQGGFEIPHMSMYAYKLMLREEIDDKKCCRKKLGPKLGPKRRSKK